MGTHPTETSEPGLTVDERIALRMLRRMLSPARPATKPVDEFDHVPQLPADTAFDLGRLQLAGPDDLEVTRDERRLLAALAAAQHSDEALLDRYLVRPAPGRVTRTSLAEAIRALGSLLAASGRTLASPPMLRWSLPAAALAVARLHGYEPGIDTIAWPRG